MRNQPPNLIVIITIILMDLLVGMEFDLFVPSFPELQQAFSLSTFWVEALLSINFLGYCICLFFVGVLADRYGRKPLILLGFIIFIIGSVFCLLGSYPLILIGRFLQGLGIASPAILSFLIIADSYPIKKQQYYMAILNGIKNASTAAAPVVGSYVTLYFHWQGNFALLLILGIIIFVMSLLFIPKYTLPAHKETLAFNKYFTIVKSKPMRLLMLNMIFISVPYWIFVGMSPLLYMKELGVSLNHFGYYQGILALVFALGSLCYGLLINKLNHKKMLHVSNLVFIASFISIIMAIFLKSTNPVFITFTLLLFVIGQIAPYAIIYPICLNLMPKLKGRVSGLLGVGSLVFQSIGLQFAAHYYSGSFREIGLIISFFLMLIIITTYLVAKNQEIQNFS